MIKIAILLARQFSHSFIKEVIVIIGTTSHQVSVACYLNLRKFFFQHLKSLDH